MRAVKVKFKNAGKQYFFATDGIKVADKDMVVVETIRGKELGFVVGNEFSLDGHELTTELKSIVRKADSIDIKKYESNKEMEPVILKDTKRLVKKNKLDMKVLSSEYTLDRSKLIIQFESENRVDFRQLVKDIAEIYKTRIELRQVGSRDGSKILGGIGPCGLILCCNKFLTEFDNVSIKMAKNQNLSLNPSKISGNCGKLLCCIKYEDEVYRELQKKAPKAGKTITTPDGVGKVLNVDVLNRKAQVKVFSTNKYSFYSFDDLTPANANN